MPLASTAVQVVTDQISAILQLLLAWLENEWVGGLDVVVDDVVGENTALSLWQEEERKLLVLLALINLTGLVRVMDIKDTSCKSGTHLTTVVPVHAKGTSLAERLVTVGEFAKASSGKNGGICGLEVAVDDQTAVVDESIVMDALEHILIYIAMSARDEYSALDFELVLLPLLFLRKISLFSVHV